MEEFKITTNDTINDISPDDKVKFFLQSKNHSKDLGIQEIKDSNLNYVTCSSIPLESSTFEIGKLYFKKLNNFIEVNFVSL